LQGADAAREFVEREPYNRAGLFKSHVIRRFENQLGRTMWEFPGASLESRFLAFAHLHTEADEHSSATTRAEFTPLQRERLIIHGGLSTPDEAAPAGVVLALQAPTAEAVDALLKDGPLYLEGPVAVEIHDWEFGGRR
jgi:uncharacterized protein YciI